MIKLEVTQGQATGTALESDDDLIGMGRAGSNALVLPDHHVSGEHASIVFNGTVWVLRDHHSTNGTRVRRAGEVIDLASQPGRELVLTSGDEIRLGEESDETGAVCVSVELDEDEADDARIVSIRGVHELSDVERAVDRELLASLYDAQKAISAAIDLDEVLSAISHEVFRFLPRATHVTVAIREQDEHGKSKKSSRYVPVGTRVRDMDSPEEAIPVTRSVFKKVVKERAAVLAADAKRDVGETASLMAAQILSTIGVPLWQGDRDHRRASRWTTARRRGSSRSRISICWLAARAGGVVRGSCARGSSVVCASRRSGSATENVYLKRREERRRFDGIIGEVEADEGSLRAAAEGRRHPGHGAHRR